MSKWWQSSGAGEIKAIPFLHPRVIQYLDNLIQPDWRILEHGSGGSTLWFAKRCEKVVAIEQDEKWLKAIYSKAIKNVTIVYDNYWEWPPYPDYDLMLIDGEPLVVRGYYLENAYRFVKPGGVVVLDNANRPQFAKEREWLKNNCESYVSFDGNEYGEQINTAYLVTDFFFLKG